MGYYTGIDVLLEVSYLCVVDPVGKIETEARVASDPEAIIAGRELGLALQLRIV